MGNKRDGFILDTFYSFVIHKKMVYLNFYDLDRVKNKEIINMMVNTLCDKVLKPKGDNLMKPLIFNLFRNVHQIRIVAGDYSFDFMLFLRMIRSVDIPETLEMILIEGQKNWIKYRFTESVERKYAAKGITAIQYDSVKLFF